MRRIPVIMAVWTLLIGQTARAQGWVESVFPERSFDFGNVARGSKVRHAFRVANRSNEEIHIANWRTKCGCTEVRVGAKEIPPGTQTTVEAVIDTTKFLGEKRSGLTLILDRPSYTEVDLNVVCNIRGDLTLNPGMVDFGTVQRTSNPTVTLNLSYTGTSPNWGITKMQSGSSHLTASLHELGRSGEGQLRYSLTAQLKPTVPNGYFKDELTLYTNDPANPTFPISVTAQVQTAVVVSPSIIVLGRVKAGNVVKKPVLVLSNTKKPFKVTSTKANKDGLSANPDPDEAQDSRALHRMEIVLKAPMQSGPFNAVVEIATDLKDEPPARLTAFATIVP